MKKMMAMLLTGALAASMVIPVMAEDAKHFTIATDTVFKPFEYTDTDGNFVGIDVDILAAIAEDQGFTNIRYFIDDGYTGTNFDRPAVKDMLALVEAGQIGTVIVKDMSRFGRDYLQVGLYTEIVFPSMNMASSP